MCRVRSKAPCFQSGTKPTPSPECSLWAWFPAGSKDPFALRRQANGIVKIIAEKKLPLRLDVLMRDARAGYQGSDAEKKFVDEAKFEESVSTFFRERLEFYLKDVRGYAYDVVKAVLAADANDVVDVAGAGRGGEAGYAPAGIPGDWRSLQAHAEYSEAGRRKRNHPARRSLNICPILPPKKRTWRPILRLTGPKIEAAS